MSPRAIWVLTPLQRFPQNTRLPPQLHPEMQSQQHGPHPALAPASRPCCAGFASRRLRREPNQTPLSPGNPSSTSPARMKSSSSSSSSVAAGNPQPCPPRRPGSTAPVLPASPSSRAGDPRHGAIGRARSRVRSTAATVICHIHHRQGVKASTLLTAPQEGTGRGHGGWLEHGPPPAPCLPAPRPRSAQPGQQRASSCGFVRAPIEIPRASRPDGAKH